MGAYQELNLVCVIALLAILPVSAVLMLLLPARIAVATTFVIGWLFLPQAQIELPGALPDWDRAIAIGVSLLAGVVVLDGGRLLRLRPSLLDLPVGLYCLAVPMASSISNDLGAYDGLAQAVGIVSMLGVPYLIGRIYFSDAEGLRVLALAVLAAGLIYMPLCMWEMRFSPQLHRTLYGFHQHHIYQSYRYGGYRPVLFLQHGLAVAMLMTCATLQGFWLWTTGNLGRRQAELGMALVVLAATTVFCKSFGAMLLLAAGGGALLAIRHLGTALPLLLLSLVPPGYMALRTSGAWDGSTPTLGEVDAQREHSYTFRIYNETLLMDKALEQPVFGWGGWGRGAVINEESGRSTVADGAWIIVLSRYGLFGLTVFTVTYLLPVWLFLGAAGPPSRWHRPEVAAGASLAVMLSIYMVDNLMNAMSSPFNLLAVGGLTGWLVAGRQARAPQRARALDDETARLVAAAVRRWGRIEVERRLALAAESARALGPELEQAYAPGFASLLLTLDPAQADLFQSASAQGRRAVVERWLGADREGAACPASAAAAP